MKVGIHKRVQGTALRRTLPKRLRGLVEAALENEATYSVVVFPGETVIRSADVTQTAPPLAKITEQNKLAFGFDFTVEACAVLTELGYRVYSEREWGWTDERYTAIRNSRTNRRL